MKSNGLLEGNPLRRWRRATGLTQNEVARRIGVSIKSVYDWEAGGIVPIKNFPALARIMGFDEAHLRGAWIKWRDRLRVA